MVSNAVQIEQTSEVSIEQLSDSIGDQFILGGEDRDDLMYLSAIAMETYEDDRYDLQRTLMEFLRNNSTINLTNEEADEIESILEEAQERTEPWR